MALNHGILPSLGDDVETNMTSDPFSINGQNNTAPHYVLRP